MLRGLTKKRDFTKGNMFKDMLLFAIPLIIATLIQLLFNAMDVAIVGNTQNGESYLAAVGATSSATHLIVNLFIGISIGANVAMANAVGARDEKRQDRVLHSSFVLSVVFGVVIMIIGVFVCGPLLKIMNVPQDAIADTGYTVLDKATTYMQIYFLGAPGMMIYNFCASIMRGLGRSDKPLIYLFVAGVVNVIINVVTVMVFDMNVVGVALGTAISQYVAAIWIVIDLIKGEGAVKLSLKKMRFDKKETKNVLLIGVPMGISRCCFSLSNILLSSTINLFGTFAVAGVSVAGTLEGILDAVASSVENTIVTAVGQNYGARQADRMRKSVLLGLVMIVVCELFFALILGFFGSHFCVLFGCKPESIEWAMKKVYIVSCTWSIAGVMSAFGGGLKGIGRSMYSMIINIFFTCVVRVLYVSFVYPYLPQVIEMVLIIYPITWLLSGGAQIITFFKSFKKIKAQMEETQSDKEMQDKQIA